MNFFGLEINSLLITLGYFFRYGFSIYIIIVSARIILTWINPNPNTPLMKFLSRLSDPVLKKARRIVPCTLGGLDFSPVVALMLLSALRYVLGFGLILIGKGAPVGVILPVAAMAALQFLHFIIFLTIIIMGLRLIMSLVCPSPYNPLVIIVYTLTEPLLAPLKDYFRYRPGGLDWRAVTFIVAAVLIERLVLIKLFILVGRWTSSLSYGII